MLALLLSTLIACSAQQEPQISMASIVAVRGDTELSPADALASAELRVDEHIRSLWEERAKRAASRQCPFWMPQVLTDKTVRRWLGDLPVQRLIKQVNRDEKERVHEFGNSYQTTLWITEDQEMVERGERRLRAELHRLEYVDEIKSAVDANIREDHLLNHGHRQWKLSNLPIKRAIVTQHCVQKNHKFRPQHFSHVSPPLSGLVGSFHHTTVCRGRGRNKDHF